MTGLLLIILLLTYTACTFWLLGKVRPIWGKGLLLAAAILLPTADEIYYHDKLESYCKNEAGFKVYRTITRREGLIDQSASAHPYDYLARHPVGFVEWVEKRGNENYYWHAEKLSDRSYGKRPIASYTAEYEFTRTERDKKPFIEIEMAIVNRKDGVLAGRFVTLNYYGGWVYQYLLGNLADSGPTLKKKCEGEGSTMDHFRLVNEVFSQ